MFGSLAPMDDEWALAARLAAADRMQRAAAPGRRREGALTDTRDPSQLRAPHAAFDPAKKLSPDLLASLAPLGVLVAAPDRQE